MLVFISFLLIVLNSRKISSKDRSIIPPLFFTAHHSCRFLSLYLLPPRYARKQASKNNCQLENAKCRRRKHEKKCVRAFNLVPIASEQALFGVSRTSLWRLRCSCARAQKRACSEAIVPRVFRTGRRETIATRLLPAPFSLFPSAFNFCSRLLCHFPIPII